MVKEKGCFKGMKLRMSKFPERKSSVTRQPEAGRSTCVLEWWGWVVGIGDRSQSQTKYVKWTGVWVSGRLLA